MEHLKSIFLKATLTAIPLNMGSCNLGDLTRIGREFTITGPSTGQITSERTDQVKGTFTTQDRIPVMVKGAFNSDSQFYEEKHIDLPHHFIRDRMARKELMLKHVASMANASDVLTKPLSDDLLMNCISALAMS
jgi:hypothetical protein